MSEYTLNTDEVLIIDEDARINDTYANGHVALTNQRVIVIHKEKKMFHKETVLSDSYPVEDLITKDGLLRFKQRAIAFICILQIQKSRLISFRTFLLQNSLMP